MPIAANRTTITATRYLGELYRIGPAAQPQGGKSAADGGAGAASETHVTTLNSTGAGSLRQAILDHNAGSVDTYIVFDLSGEIDWTSDSNASITRGGLTIDARGQAISIRGASGGGRMINVNNASAITDLCFYNLSIIDSGIGGVDGAMSFGFANGDVTPVFIVHQHMHQHGDDMITVFMDDEANVGLDYTVTWSHFRGNSGSTAKGDYTSSGPDEDAGLHFWENNDAANIGNFRGMSHHNYYNSLHMRQPFCNPDVGDGTPEIFGVNDICRWDYFVGQWLTGPASFHGDSCTYDSQDTSNFNRSYRVGLAPPSWSDPNSNLAIDNPRYVNNAVAGSADQGTAILWSDRFSGWSPCATSASHDARVRNRTGNTLQVTASGTLGGTDEDAISGTTLILTFPSTHAALPAAGAAFDAIRQSIIDDIQILYNATGATAAAAGDIWTNVSDVARTSDRVVTLTASGNPSITDDAIVFYEGTSLTSDYLLSWNEQTINNVSAQQQASPISYPGAAHRLRRVGV